MAYQKFALVFILIDHLSLFKISKTPTLQKSFHCNFFSINFENMFVEKELSVYRGEKE